MIMSMKKHVSAKDFIKTAGQEMHSGKHSSRMSDTGPKFSPLYKQIINSMHEQYAEKNFNESIVNDLNNITGNRRASHTHNYHN